LNPYTRRSYDRLVKALQLRWDAWQARRVKRHALLELGSRLPTPEQDEKIARLEGMLSVSLARDRADWAAVANWAKPLVILRGIFDRTVLRALARKARQDRDHSRIDLAVKALDDAKGPLADAARAAHAEALRAEAALAPLPLPVREAQHFGKYLVHETRARVLPRLPALVGLAVGYAIAQTFTDSQLSATLHSWGIGDGPRHAVRSETLRAMSFWLPLFAAAVTSYAGSRLAALVKKRYETATSAAE
jgi:hypothetical protein